MRSYLSLSLVGLTLACLAPTLNAQFFVRGEFNGWGLDDPMTDQGADLHTHQLTGLTPGGMYLFKIANDDWSIQWPGNDARVMADPQGEILFRAFDSDTWTDGWLPNNVRRVGYSDAGHGWELLGTMTEWEVNPLALTLDGDGVYRGEVFLSAGDHDYKFRITDSWDINIGADFSNSAANVTLNVASDATYLFELDPLNGRHIATAIPEPSTYAAIFGGLALLGACVYRRRGGVTKK